MFCDGKLPPCVDALDTAAPRACWFGGGGSGGGGTQTTVSQPYSTNAADAALNTATAMFNDPGSWARYYPGTTVAPFTDAQNAALSGTINTASAGSPLTQPTMDFARTLEGGGYLYNNPGS